MSRGIHETAAAGFEVAAADYEANRADYPEPAVDRLIQELEIRAGARILDLAAGTGKLTRMLVPTGAQVVAVEPVEAMRRACADAVPGVPVVAGTAEALPFGNATLDGVVVGQAFRWFDGQAALREIHRVLRPAGRLALLWNLRNETVDWVRRLGQIVAPHERGTPGMTGEWHRAFAATDLFGSLHRLRFPHEQRLDQEGLARRVASMSFIARLPRDEREGILQEVRALGREAAGEDGAVLLPYDTDLYWCSRRDEGPGTA